jgi:nicotinamidase-related amidase
MVPGFINLSGEYSLSIEIMPGKTIGPGLIGLLLFIILISGNSATAISEKTIPSDVDQHTALLLIDIQNFYFQGGSVPLKNSGLASQKAKTILAFFRQKGLPVIHVKHMPRKKTEAGEQTHSNWRIHKDVFPVAGEKVIVKHQVNCFLDTGLLSTLERNRIQKLVVCGMQTHMCLEAGVRAASDYGFLVTVIQDACASRDLVFKGVSIPARLVHASTLATLESAYAKVLTAGDFLREQKLTGDVKKKEELQ